MSRFARAVVPFQPHHVTQRGNGRRAVFFSPADREVYLGLLAQYSRFYSVRVLGYSLMTNHVHLVLVPEHLDSLARTLREAHARYSRFGSPSHARKAGAAIEANSRIHFLAFVHAIANEDALQASEQFIQPGFQMFSHLILRGSF